MYRMQVLKKGTDFVDENATIFAIFHIRYVFFSTSYFYSEKDPTIVKIVSHILQSLNYKRKIVKILRSDNRQNHVEKLYVSK